MPIINSTVKCVSELYTGNLCTGLLKATQTCALGTRNSILVNTSGMQQVLETNLTTFFSILGSQLSFVQKWNYLIIY